ncbi:MAG TPA: L-alanine exporter AlaE [Candidatus Nanoarchaeia archaeon]|nr:L-alanine exporter AlaE [Candidatus Nanoarchaeia archaeon]
MGRARNIAENLEYHLVDSTAMLAESTPVFSAFEVGIAGMSNEVSINSRICVVGLTYLGMGWTYGKGRDIWRRAFNITHESREEIQNLHDAAYAVVCSLLVSFPIYWLAGETSFKKIAVGTLCSAAFGMVNGGPIGQAIDGFRDLTGLRENRRKCYPEILRRQSRKLKRVIAIGGIAASLSLTSLIYKISSGDNSHYMGNNRTEELAHRLTNR